MSIQDKQTLVADVEEQIGDFLTVTHTRAVKAVLENELVNYDVEALDEAEINYDLLELFLKAKSVEGKSVKTIAQYRLMCSKAIEYIGKPIERITTDDIRDYLAREKRRGIADRSLENRRSDLSSMFTWLHDNKYIQINPIKGVTRIKYLDEVKEPYSQIEIDALKKACKDIRNETLILFMYSTGTRVSEISNLDIKDVDFAGKKCKVLGKGNKERIVLFDDLTASYLQRYLSTRNDNNPAMFVGKKGRLGVRGIQKMLRKLAKETGIEKVHPHKFRRTFATETLKNGMPVQVMAKILGHENLQTTMKYTYISDKDMEAEYRRYFA